MGGYDSEGLHGPVIGQDPENQTKKECDEGITRMMETAEAVDLANKKLDEAIHADEMEEQARKAIDSVINGDLDAMQDDYARDRLRSYIGNLIQIINLSKQEHKTKCAVCGEIKPCPVRTALWTEDGEGYVCLTCIDKRLSAMSGSDSTWRKLEKVVAELKATNERMAALEASVKELKIPLHDTNECPYCHARFQSKVEREEHISKHSGQVELQLKAAEYRANVLELKLNEANAELAKWNDVGQVLADIMKAKRAERLDKEPETY